MGDPYSLDDLAAKNQQALYSLFRAITLSRGEFSLILMRCNYQQLWEKYLQELSNHLPSDYKLLKINLPPQTTSIYSTIEDRIAGNVVDSIANNIANDIGDSFGDSFGDHIRYDIVDNITGDARDNIEDSFGDNIAGNIVNNLGQSSPDALIILGLENVINLTGLLTSANQIRDEFRNKFPLPIVLVVNDRILTSLVRYAPDFNNWAVTPISLQLNYLELVNLLEVKVNNICNYSQQLEQYLTIEDLSKETVELDFALKDLEDYQYQLPPELSAKLEFVLGRNAYSQQELEKALLHYQLSLEFWQTNHDQQAQGLVLANIALCYCRLAERQQAQKQLHWQSAWLAMEQAVNNLSQVNCPELVSQILSQQGEILQYLQAWTPLKDLAERAKLVHETCGKTIEMAQDYGFLAMVAIAQARWQDSIKLATQALESLVREFPIANDDLTKHPLILQGLLLGQLYRLFLVKAHSALGNFSQSQQNLIIARKQLDIALKLSDHRADPQHYLDILKHLRNLYFDQGCYLEAFHIKQQQLSVEQLYGFRAFIGARRLQPQPIYGKSFPTLNGLQTTVAAEIRVSSRYQDLQNMMTRLNRADHRLIVLHGESGVGKSSLIHAGLIPTLQEQGVGDRVAMPITIQVYTNWLKELAKALSLENDSPISTILEHLRQQEKQHALTVMIFDQFEEFFFYNTDNQQRTSFFEFLRDCLNISYVKVILSLREDGLHYLLNSEQVLLDPINNNILDRKIRYPLGNFSIADARSVVTTLTHRADFEIKPDLINEIVAELAGQNQEIRPIELQLVGTQVQSENITTLEQYHESGLKQRLAERFLEQVVQDCGTENAAMAWQVLYFLTAENNIRPLKTRLELIADLELDQGAFHPTLDLILEILEKSGLVFLLPEIPFPRYQLVHDYLVEFIRQREEVNTKLQIEDYKQRQISNQETIERLEFALREKALIAELTVAKLGQQDSENKLNQILQQRLTGARLWGLGFLTSAMIAGVFAIQASLKETNAQIGAIVSSSESLILSNRKFDALVESLKAGRMLNSLGDNRWGDQWGASVDTKIRVLTTLQQTIEQIRESNRLEGHTDWVMGLAFSANGQLIATASKDQTIKVWNPQGHLLREVATGGELDTISFSPNSQLIAVGGTGQQVQLWNYGTGKVIWTISPKAGFPNAHRDTVSSVVFSPDGQSIASGSWDKTIKIWNLQGQLVSTLRGHSNRVLGVDFAPDGKTLVSVGADGLVIFWQQDAKGEFQRQQAWQAPGQDTDKVITSVKFAPNHRALAVTGASGQVFLWQRDGITQPWSQVPSREWEVSQDWVLSVAFSPDSRSLAVGNTDNTVQVWDLAGNLVDTFRGHGNLVRAVGFSPDGKILASGSGDSTVKFWRRNDFTQKIIQSKAVNTVSTSPRGESIATGSQDHLIRLWSTGGNLLKELAAHTDSINSVVFSHNGKFLASGSDDETLRLWTVQGVTEQFDKPPVNPSRSTDTERSRSTDTERSRSGDLIQTINAHEGGVNGIAFSPNDRLIASAGGDKTAKIWSTTGELLQTLVGHEDNVNTVAFAPGGEFVATGSDDQTVKIWSLEVPEPSRSGVTERSRSSQLLRTFPENNGAVNYLAISADGKLLAAATNKGTIRLWSMDGTLITTLRGHNGSVNWVGFAPDGRSIASVSEDKTLKFWRLDGNLITTLSTSHSEAIFEASFSKDGNFLVSADQDGRVVVWNLNLESLIRQGCTWLADYKNHNPNAEPGVCDR
ncbi:MAG: AAA family ATPase [Coleofasciculaceae cyanobacterium SM2_1_6]|nr:AAA family ATPase [Coleofasciculaceae cyanobacterium SM2_1_6]